VSSLANGLGLEEEFMRDAFSVTHREVCIARKVVWRYRSYPHVPLSKHGAVWECTGLGD